MGLTENEIKQVKEDFESDFKWDDPNSILKGVGISTLQHAHIWNENFSLSEGESLEDRCLFVGFFQAPSAYAKWPDVYKGARVVYSNNYDSIRTAGK